MKIGVVDYGINNLNNIVRCLEYLGIEVTICSDRKKIQNARKLILPGVGSFYHGMSELQRRDLVVGLQEFVASGRPILGVCLGMQLFMEASEENGDHQGLGFIDGKVEPIPMYQGNKKIRKVPNVGWNALRLSREDAWKHTYFNEVRDGEFFYFSHSFMVKSNNMSHVLGYCDYGGIRVTSVIVKENLTGVQFHPELSGRCGVELLKRFSEYKE